MHGNMGQRTAVILLEHHWMSEYETMYKWLRRFTRADHFSNENLYEKKSYLTAGRRHGVCVCPLSKQEGESLSPLLASSSDSCLFNKRKLLLHKCCRKSYRPMVFRASQIVLGHPGDAQTHFEFQDSLHIIVCRQIYIARTPSSTSRPGDSAGSPLLAYGG